MTKAIVYIMAGCPACHDYTPRIREVARVHKVPLEIVNVSFPRGATKANRHSVRATPTTDFFTEKGTVVRRIGALDNPTLIKLLG
jgi:thiol-disulfide isomerase/thioredoxin